MKIKVTVMKEFILDLEDEDTLRMIEEQVTKDLEEDPDTNDKDVDEAMKDPEALCDAVKQILEEDFETIIDSDQLSADNCEVEVVKETGE